MYSSLFGGREYLPAVTEADPSRLPFPACVRCPGVRRSPADGLPQATEAGVGFGADSRQGAGQHMYQRYGAPC